MDAVNKTLLLSLKQEVKTLNEVVKTFPLPDDGDEIRSWLFPSKSYDFVNELICTEEIFKLDNFKTYLELIIDRLYVGIRLILNYVEEKTVNQQKRIRFIHRPKLITLGFTFQRLLQAVSDICQDMSNIESNQETTIRDNNSSTGKLFNKESQTNIISLNKCDSCSSAISCMRNLLKSFEKRDFLNPWTERRLQPKIYDITQFGSMLQTTTVVEKGVNQLYEKLFCVEQEKESLEHENRQMKADFINKCEKISFLENEVEVLKDKCEKDTLKISLLSNQNEELLKIKNQQDLKITTLSDVIGNLNASIRSYNEKVVELVTEKEKISSLYDEIVKEQLIILKVAASLQAKLSAIEQEHLSLKHCFKQLEDGTDNINKRLNKTTGALCVASKKIVDMKENSVYNVSVLQSKLEVFKEIFYQNKGEDTSSKQNTFEMKGDPVEDLSRQMEQNSESIKKLENENIKLKSIICRLQCLKK